MLSYQHEYHAGNHADVLKHSVLALVLAALLRKDKPLRVFDAHAGSGLYDLGSREARRHAEYRGGIARVLAAADAPPALAPYLDALRACNAGGALQRYPGSPWLARSLLRPADHLVLMELHPQALTALRRLFGQDPQVHLHERDCFEGLPALGGRAPPAASWACSRPATGAGRPGSTCSGTRCCAIARARAFPPASRRSGCGASTRLRSRWRARAMKACAAPACWP